MQLIRLHLRVQIVLDLINDNIGTLCTDRGRSEGQTSGIAGRAASNDAQRCGPLLQYAMKRIRRAGMACRGATKRSTTVLIFPHPNRPAICNLQSAIDTPRALPRAEIYTQCRLAYAKRTWLDRSHSGISILLGHEPRSDR